MIYESYVYKDELHKIANRMEKRLTQKRWTEHSGFLYEKDVFIASFIIRKLIETGVKISTDTAQMDIILVTYMPTGTKPTILNRDEWRKIYNVEHGHRVTKKLQDICNALIHSYVWAPYFEKEGELSGFVFTSDFEKTKGLFHYALKDFISMLKKVGDDYPCSLKLEYCKEKEDYVYSSVK